MQFLPKRCRGRGWLFSPSISRTLQLTGSRIVYPLAEVLLLPTCATIAGCDDLGEIVAWGEVPCRISGSGSSRTASPRDGISQSARMCPSRVQ
jgi:hypothetical protein